MPIIIEGAPVSDLVRFAVVVSRFNATITERLLEGALRTLQDHGVNTNTDRVTVVRCPGAFEIPLIASKLAQTHNYDAVICLAAIIRGDTYHFELVSQGVARGVLQTSLKTGVPVTLGVITAEDMEQSIERSGPNTGNKGVEATTAALEMVSLMGQI